MKGVLLIHTGSPESDNPIDLKKFQQEILKDPFVIHPEHGIPEFNSDHSHSNHGGLSFHEIARSFQNKILENNKFPIAFAMHYGNPSIESGFRDLEAKGVKEILALPFYPQYATSTVGSVIQKAEDIRDAYFPEMKTDYIDAYYDRLEYIEVMAESILRAVDNIDETHIVFSYHGVPEYFSMERDFFKNQCTLEGTCCNPSQENHNLCYKKQCRETSELIAEKLGLKSDVYTTAFQARLGLEPWLKPSTKNTIKKLAKKGIKNLVLVSPGFSIDCPDTISMASVGESNFKTAGGKTFTAIPCLNDSDAWIDVVSRWIFRWRIIDFKTAIA